MNNADKNYFGVAEDILENGVIKEDRTGTGTLSVFGREVRYDLSEGFPLFTTKYIPFGLIKSENLWFSKGLTNIRFLLEHNNHIWDEWAIARYFESVEYEGPDMTDFGRRAANDEEFRKIYEEQNKIFCDRILSDDGFAEKWGDLGPVYGAQWRNFKYYDEYTGKVESVDQFQTAIDLIKNNPDSRRIMVVAWHPGYVKYQALPPCHYAFQFYVAEGKLSCKFEMRSNDYFLGNPFNVAGYALITHMVAKECGLDVGELIFSGGDVHLYLNHIEQMKEQLSREPRELPTLWLNPEVTSIYDYTMDDIKVIGYDPHPSIKAPVAV